ncbi:hypothetical protein GJAV_G00144890 [Gymnothorax javanicus]|nr:hypothetical protein GJAV_G00144890 [Gymnothorax javanicus]
MLSPPDDKGSPIRMRLRRVFPNSARKSGDASDFEIRSPLTAQNPSESKNRKRAKKLVLKARELQQSKKTAVADTDNKRMLRTRDVPKSYCEDEDSIVCLSDVQKSPAPDARDEASGQKRLRSLNDVLGRNAAESKAAKNTTGPKVAAMFLGKKPQRPAAVISIFDDSSQEGSENSQDDEHFKARREFLKSGLPESFKRQIARTTASRDAYTLACASFQPVVHVLQRALDCPLWSLPWPVSPLLKHLNSTCRSPPRPLLSPGALDCVKIEPAVRAHTDRGSSWRQDFSEDIRKRLLEEIRASNPAFPVRRFFTWFLKKREEHLLRPVSADKVTQTPSPTDPPEACGKRKRRGDGEAVGKLPKRRRSARGEQEVVVITDDSPVGQTDPSAVVAPVGRARLRRARGGRLVQQGAVVAERTPVQNDAVIVLTDSPPPGNTDQVDCAQEDVLWTEKYQPQHSSEVIGNSAAVRRLRCWLEEWKQRADREERRSHRERSQEDCSNDSWDCGDFQGEGGLEDGEEALCNTLLITGPPGVGKTAAVYACAQELGFKVFEVNASSQRSGRQILSQLKEATQSHQVDIQGVNAHKPAYFNSYSAGSTRPGASPKKLSSPRKVVSSPRRPQNSPCRKRGALAPTSLANFFKLSNKPKGRTTSTETHLPQNEAGPQKPSVTKKSVLKTREPPAKLSSDKKEPQTDEQSKKTATSLILFEEVDVIFDDDSGFLAAIKTFMTTTKRPVILTTNDPTFSAMFDGNFEEINFKMPSEVNVRSYLQLLCLAENVRTEAQDLSSLLCWNSCDIRRTLLHLQFWVRSGGRPGPPRPLPPLHPAEPAEGEAGPEDPVKPADEEKPLASSAPCDSGCTESLLGILNIDGTLGLSDMLKSHRCEELLVESWERRVDLLYSNMEELLPLPVCTRQAPLLSQQGALKPEPGSSAPPEDESPVKRSSRRRLSLKERDLFESDSDSDDCFLSLPKLEKASNSEAPSAGADGSELAAAREEPPAGSGSCRQRKVDRSPEEQRSSELLSRCLGSLAEFMDHMSFLDSSVEHRRWQPEGACRPGAFGWAGAEVKSGLWDEARVEDGSGAGRESSAQIRAAVEGLSFRRCESSVSQVWAQAQELREDLGGESQLLNQLTLPVGPHRTALSVCQTSPCQPTVTQRRCEVMKTMLTSRAFCTLGNKSAAATDYLPFLRTVCRSERLKEQGKVKRRFLHYLDSIHLGLPKSTLQHLATEFP